MPFTKEDLDILPIYFHKPGEATVLVGPCSGTAWKGSKIPLDGRHYHCAGTIILKNGKKIRADLKIHTHDFDFLERDSVYCFLDGLWYRWDEPELLEKLHLTKEEAFPFRWITDKPLDYHVKGPYQMKWPEEKNS